MAMIIRTILDFTSAMLAHFEGNKMLSSLIIWGAASEGWKITRTCMVVY